MIVYSSYLRTEDEFPSYGTTEEYAIKSADYQGGHTTTLVGCTKTVEAIDVGDCRIKITFIDPTVAPSRRTSQGLWTATAHEGGRFVEGLLDGGSLYLVAPDWRYTLAMAVDTADRKSVG